MTPEAFRDAADRIRESILRTPLVYSPTMSRMFGGKIFLKLENLQVTGSFKVRGAANRLLALGYERIHLVTPPEELRALAAGGGEGEVLEYAVKMRRFGQEVIRVTAGKRVHGTGAIPGGVNKAVTRAERDELLKDIYQIVLMELLDWNIVDRQFLGRDRILDGNKAKGRIDDVQEQDDKGDDPCRG